MKILYIIYLFFIIIVKADRVRVYERIPQNFVATSVYNFLKDNNINNCFAFKESNSQLLLKCWRYNELTNVEINIYNKPSKPVKKVYYTGLSIVV